MGCDTLGLSSVSECHCAVVDLVIPSEGGAGLSVWGNVFGISAINVDVEDCSGCQATGTMT